jgi:hypothetical protein
MLMLKDHNTLEDHSPRWTRTRSCRGGEDGVGSQADMVVEYAGALVEQG